METLSKESICACALGHIFGYEPLYAFRLVQELGCAEAVFSLPGKELNEILGPYSKYRDAVSPAALDDAEKELIRLAGKGCRFLPLTDPAFPDLLRDSSDPPAGLYYKSVSPPAEIFSAEASVGVVGTRDISPYGKDWTVRLVSAMGRCAIKPCIVSGLAYGVDINAHLAALNAGLPTIAVLPCGIDEVYPFRHRAAAERIASTQGCAIVTDYPPGTAPMAYTFVRRNRIIAGLARAVVLVESKIKGGGLITCRLASEYGRDVYAVPGRLDDTRSAGCNMLLARKEAEAVFSAEVLCTALGLGKCTVAAEPALEEKVREHYSAVPEGELESLCKVAELIRRFRGIDMDEICRMTGYPYNEVGRLCYTLEADGFICTDLLQRCSVNNFGHPG